MYSSALVGVGVTRAMAPPLGRGRRAGGGQRHPHGADLLRAQFLSPGYERTHINSLDAVARLLALYMQAPPLTPLVDPVLAATV